MASGKRVPVHFADDVFLIDDQYVYRGTPLGTKKRREIYLGVFKGSAQKDVLKARDEKILEAKKVGTSGSAGGNAFNNICALYVDAREREALNPKVLSRSSIRECRIMANRHFIPYAKSKRIEEINQRWFEEYCEYKAKRGLSLPNHRKFINHFLRWCVIQGYITMFPELRIPKIAIKEKRQRVVLSEKQSQDLLRATVNSESEFLLLYVILYLFNGLRNKEILALRRDEVDLTARALRVNPENNRRRKGRVVPVNSFALTLLRKQLESHASEWVFPATITFTKGKKPTHITTVRTAWLTALKKCGLTRIITPHDLRATFETHMHMNTDFTDTQREKMAGANIDVQKRDYITMDASKLRGLEKSVQIKGVREILGGKQWGEEGKKKPSKAVSLRKKGRNPR